MSEILIIKTSSLGDILQSFYVLPYLKQSGYSIDFVVDSQYEELARSHPLIDKVIVSDLSGWFTKKNKKVSFLSFIRSLRKKNYAMAFDLQRNWKSSFILLFVKALRKIGYGKKSVREKINLLFTNEKYEISQNQNIRRFYLEIFSRAMPSLVTSTDPSSFKLSVNQTLYLQSKKCGFKDSKKNKILVALGSNWENKRIPFSQALLFLQKIEQNFPCYFFFCYGTLDEKKKSQALIKGLKSSELLEKVPIPIMQKLICEMDMVVAVDSSILSLTEMTNTPSFSFFGPTKGTIFSPTKKTKVYQGACPYKISFEKQCPKLRTCKTGDCLKAMSSDEAFLQFVPWASQYLQPFEKKVISKLNQN